MDELSCAAGTGAHSGIHPAVCEHCCSRAAGVDGSFLSNAREVWFHVWQTLIICFEMFAFLALGIELLVTSTLGIHKHAPTAKRPAVKWEDRPRDLPEAQEESKQLDELRDRRHWLQQELEADRHMSDKLDELAAVHQQWAQAVFEAESANARRMELEDQLDLMRVQASRIHSEIARGIDQQANEYRLARLQNWMRALTEELARV